MNSDNVGKEYATKDIANIVDIAPPTVRKYAQALEKAGYTFIKNEKGVRFFNDKDIFAFNEMKNISKKNGMPVERIAEMIVFNQRQKIQHEAFSDTVELIQAENEDKGNIVQYEPRYNELMSKLSKLDILDDIVKELQEVKETNKILAEQVKQQQIFITESLKQRDRELMESIRGLQEQKQAQLETAASHQQTKKGFFARLFGKE